MGVATVGAGLRPHAPALRPRGGLRRRPGARADADHRRDLAPQQPRRAARPVLRPRRCGAVVRGARGRPHALARPGRRLRRPRLRDEDGAPRCSWSRRSPRPGCGSRRAGALAAAAPARCAGGAAMAVVGLRLAGARVADAGGRPPLGLRARATTAIWSLIFGYNGLGRLAGQSGGPGGGGGRRAGGGGGGGGLVRRQPGPAAAAQRAPSAARPAGCSASRSWPASLLVAVTRLRRGRRRAPAG